MDIYFLLFEDFKTLDVFGPVEILSRIEKVKLHYISLSGGIIKSKQGFYTQTESITGIAPNSIVVVPGGQGTRSLVSNELFIKTLRNLCDRAENVLSICTGSALLAKSGVLDKRNATSNKKAFDWVRSISQNVNWIKKARWVVDEKYYTSSGVSAGMDMSLGFISDLFGIEKAKQIAFDIEYFWNSNKECDDFE